jgi:hypothetical protein
MEVERNPVPPELSDKAIELITELCFRKDDDLKNVDGIFVYASTVSIEKMVSLLDDILSRDISNKIFITGGATPKHLAEELGIEPKFKEADLLLNAFELERYNNLEVFVERESTNTLENVTEMLKFKEFKNCKSLLFIFKSHPAGRGYLTLRKYFPEAEILQKTFNAKYDKAEKEITRDNWFIFDFGRRRVWGEYLRIQKYGRRGDIEYDEVRGLVEEIAKETKKTL